MHLKIYIYTVSVYTIYSVGIYTTVVQVKLTKHNYLTKLTEDLIIYKERNQALSFQMFSCISAQICTAPSDQL